MSFFHITLETKTVPPRRKPRPHTTAEKLAAIKKGVELPIDLDAHEEVGTVPGPDVRAALQLATAYQQEEDPDYSMVTHKNLKRAERFFNENGLIATLDEILRVGGVEALRLD